MSVLEAPATWIAAAAVLVVIAVVLIALAPRRRSGGASAATVAVPESAGSAAPEAAASSTSRPASSDGDEDDAVTGPVLPAARPEPVAAQVVDGDEARTENVRLGAGEAPRDEAPARPALPRESLPEPAPAAADPVTAGTPSTTVRERYVPVTDPARADGHAKDRLLAALLSDPAAAVDVVAAMGENGGPASGSSAAALLRAGLSPAQVAQLCGVEAGDLATLVARDLGLLEAARGGGAQRERSRTEEPGRAWANAGSAAGSTTPTTG